VIKSKTILLGFAINSAGPLILSTLHENPLISILSLLPMIALTMMVYYYLKVEWTKGGFYNYSKKISPLFGKMQLYTWILSYFLYIVYTVDYIDFYVLNLPNTEAYTLTILLPIIASILVFTDLVYLALIGTAFMQIILSLPIMWKFSVNLKPEPFSFLFINILSSSILLACITLNAYIEGDKKYANVVIYSLGISSILLISGDFFMSPRIVFELSSIADFSLILAEYTALRNLFSFIGIRKKFLYFFPISVVILSAISLINYNAFYLITIAPSDTSLFISLLIPSIIFPFYKKGIGYLISAVNVVLMTYGIYDSITTFHGIYFYDSIIPPLIALILPLIEKRIKS
jgi:hypothetical protein